MFSRRTCIAHHLRANLFPPVSVEFVEAAEKSIDLVNAGEFRASVELPGGGTATALECIDALRLELFVDAFAE